MKKNKLFEQPVERKTLAERLAYEIESMILANELESGMSLPSELELAQQYGASRSVARDATRILMAKGLVEVKHGRGVFVTEPGSETFVESFLLTLTRTEAYAWDLRQLEQRLYAQVVSLAIPSASNEELENIAAGSITIGNSQSGPISISHSIDRGSPTDLTLTTGGDHSITITAGQGIFSAGGDITLNTGIAGSGLFADSNGPIDLRGGTITFNTNVAPGSSPGQLVVGSALAFNGQYDLHLEIDGTTPITEFDQILVTGYIPEYILKSPALHRDAVKIPLKKGEQISSRPYDHQVYQNKSLHPAGHRREIKIDKQ